MVYIIIRSYDATKPFPLDTHYLGVSKKDKAVTENVLKERFATWTLTKGPRSYPLSPHQSSLLNECNKKIEGIQSILLRSLI
jgi:hypothetical protein